jgi:hypothetical protein
MVWMHPVLLRPLLEWDRLNPRGERRRVDLAELLYGDAGGCHERLFDSPDEYPTG